MGEATDNAISTGAARQRSLRRRWGLIGALALSLTLLVSGCTLWVDRQVVVQGGATGLYAYIGSNPSSQIQDVYTAICRRDANCTSTIMTSFKLGLPDWIKRAWNEGWWHWYSQGEAMFALNQIAYNRWISGGQRNTCLVLVKTTLPFPTPGGVINYRWQTRGVGNDGCIRGLFLDPRATGRAAPSKDAIPLRLDPPESAAKQQDLFCAPLGGSASGANQVASLARRLVSSNLASDRRGSTAVVSSLLAAAPQGVASPAKRLVAAIELGRANSGVAALKTAGARDAIGDVGAWAEANC